MGEAPYCARLPYFSFLGAGTPMQIRPSQGPRSDSLVKRTRSTGVRFVIRALAVVYFSPRLLGRFDLAVRAISIRRRIASGRPGLSGWLEAHGSTRPMAQADSVPNSLAVYRCEHEHVHKAAYCRSALFHRRLRRPDHHGRYAWFLACCACAFPR